VLSDKKVKNSQIISPSASTQNRPSDANFDGYKLLSII
jgi:hypothetical protein